MFDYGSLNETKLEAINKLTTEALDKIAEEIKLSKDYVYVFLNPSNFVPAYTPIAWFDICIEWIPIAWCVNMVVLDDIYVQNLRKQFKDYPWVLDILNRRVSLENGS